MSPSGCQMTWRRIVRGGKSSPSSPIASGLHSFAASAPVLVSPSLAIAAMGIYVADADDAPGAAVMGLLLMVVGVVLGVRAARNRLRTWAARTEGILDRFQPTRTLGS